VDAPSLQFFGRICKLAAEPKGRIAAGKNPQKERRAVRAEMTFGALFEDYMTKYSTVHKRSWEYDEREVNKFLPYWFKRKISSIDRAEVERLHAKIGKENGTTQANRLLERIRSIFNMAIDWGWDGANPAAGIKKFKEKSRDRFLQPDELAAQQPRGTLLTRDELAGWIERDCERQAS
jgi:site-specific recombinase XerD